MIAGQESLRSLRRLSYSDTQVFLLGFSINSLASLQNVASTWIPDITEYCPDAVIILAGFKADMRGGEGIYVETEKAQQVCCYCGWKWLIVACCTKHRVVAASSTVLHSHRMILMLELADISLSCVLNLICSFHSDMLIMTSSQTKLPWRMTQIGLGHT